MADRYLMSTGNWDDDNTWAATDGGSPPASFPVAGDNAFLSAASGAVTLTVNVPSACADFNCDGFAGTLAGGSALSITGNITLSAGMTRTWTGGLAWLATTAVSITSNTKALSSTIDLGQSGVSTPTFQLADNLTTGSGLRTTLLGGTLDLNGETLSSGEFNSSGATTRTIKSSLDGGVIATTRTTASAVAWNTGNSTGLTIDRVTGSWSIQIGGNTTSLRQVVWGSVAMPALTFTNTSNGPLNFLDGGTFKSISVSNPPDTLRFTAGTTTTIEDDDGFPEGTSGNLVTIASITAANHALAKSGGGTVTRSFLSISRSDASPASTWFANDGTSTDGGNNSGWTFTAAAAAAGSGDTPRGNAGAFFAKHERRKTKEDALRKRGEFEVDITAAELIKRVAARHLDSDDATLIVDLISEFKQRYMRWQQSYIADALGERDRMIAQRAERIRKEEKARQEWLDRRQKQRGKASL
jgi:hypothetical protein